MKAGTRRVRKHVQNVDLGFFKIGLNLEGLVNVPIVLPFGFSLVLEFFETLIKT